MLVAILGQQEPHPQALLLRLSPSWRRGGVEGTTLRHFMRCGFTNSHLDGESSLPYG